MKHPEVAELMAKLYFDETTAKAVLIRAGYPPHVLPPFGDASSFWTSVIQQMELGLGPADTLPQLIAQTAGTFQGNLEMQAMHAKWTGTEPPATAAPVGVSPDGPCHTLTLVGADLPDEFLQVIRDQLGSETAELLYVSKQQCSVEIPDPGSGAGKLQQQIQEMVETFTAGSKIKVSYAKYKFRPYLYSQLTVFGPDTTPYLLQSVPATTTPEDIAAAIVAQTRATNERSGGPISTVIDAVTDEGPERLDPEKTLHENNVKDKDKMHVGIKAVAGNISPELRLEAQMRMRAQIRRFALGHPAFEIVEYDNEDLPDRITFELEGPGLAPPENLTDFLAGSENISIQDYRALNWAELRPVEINFHRFTMHLREMFPVVAPYVIWRTPVFHPNIWRLPQPGVYPGTVCLGPLMDGYRPDLDFGWLCQLLIDIGTYRNYDVVDAPTYPDPPAALWARTEPGQELIQSIGGPPMRQTTQREDEKPIAPALWLSPLAEHMARGNHGS
ncbi:effector-associated domain EAD1-containing protein [Actinocrispum wychmicini]|uniref:Ubiquitin-protein ligase n=1 Tax=Actinocrispum wychmicini TaxID=1213861 RepID=A0A4R2J348_9PSEU|nr:effector-associated domain EAD1-containing protein [Actinocrispum wychmicini]TCO52881.1 ubiquitin-protein ligase [Actinocrispum wychmicini]